jgi:hypothetical protein
MQRLPIMISPPLYRSRLAWVFNHLERLYPVVFTAGDASQRETRIPAIHFSEPSALLPELRGTALVYALDPPARGTPQHVTLTSSSGLDRRLRGRVLEERSLPPLRPLDPVGADVFALCEGAPVWIRQTTAAGHIDTVRMPGVDHLKIQMLWDNLQQHRFFFFLPLVHHLYDVLGPAGWTPPPLRASLVVDDPNLRTASYGWLRYADVARSAREHRFHISVAVAALDLAATSHRMAAFMAGNADVFSLSIHGNNHTRQELMDPGDVSQAIPLLSQMLHRVDEFERAYKVPVSRVIVPPHEMCSAAVLRALRRFPVDAVVASRPFPWLPGNRWTSALGPDDTLRCWLPGDFVLGGSPIIRRSSIRTAAHNTVFRAFLNQPVIRFFHHGRFSGRMESLLATAADINSLGNVRWLSLGEIALSNFDSQRHRSMLLVRPYSRRVRVDIPEGVTTLEVDTSLMRAEGMLLRVGRSRPVCAGQPGSHEVEPGSRVDVLLDHREPIAYRSHVSTGTPFPALAHRRFGELVDRLKLRRT